MDARVGLILIAIVVGGPLALAALLGVASLAGRPFAERSTTRLVPALIGPGLLAAAVALALMLASGTRHMAVDLGDWVSVGPSYHFSIKFAFDRLSIPLAILSLALSGTIGTFAGRYLHRERGFNRFFALYAIFVLGMVMASLAGTIETLFAGWELVGLSSALLVAFYHERAAPARNALWVWCVYRVSDAALLLAAVAMHRIRGQGDFGLILGSAPWPEARSAMAPGQALPVGLLLLVAAAGKSGLVPFSGWLPRAMEGPTPSSAVFYGALSVHLGAFLLMRVGPILEVSMLLGLAVLALGLATAAFGTLVGSVQTDIKSALAFASLAQVGLIVAELGLAAILGHAASGGPGGLLGRASLALRYGALVHLLGHACLRTLQFLRAPTLLHDYHTLEDAIGGHPPGGGVPLRPPVAPRLRARLYRFALERGHLDAAILRYVVDPFVGLLGRSEALERRWAERLAGPSARGSGPADDPPGAIEGLP